VCVFSNACGSACVRESVFNMCAYECMCGCGCGCMCVCVCERELTREAVQSMEF
jgi:hypothetical protein